MSKKPTLRDLSRKLPSEAEAEAMLAEVSKGTDRSAAILSLNLVDAIIKKFILSSLVHGRTREVADFIFEDNGALPSLSSRIEIAYAMGLIDKNMRGDLGILRKVRNAFAHTPVNIDFCQPEISREIRKISDWNLALSAKQELIKQHDLPNGLQPSDERLVFIACCNVICARLLIRTIKIVEATAASLEKKVKDMKEKLQSSSTGAAEN